MRFLKRNYVEIEQQIAETGFFSEYLPPCFKLNSKALLYPPQTSCDLIPPVSFTMSRFNANDARRRVFIPEIGAYAVARQFMKEHQIIKEIIEFSEQSEFSFSPILGKDDSIMRHEQAYGCMPDEDEETVSNYVENVAKKIVRAAGAKKILKLDISNCFHSFYIHMIPAIILGKEVAEANYNKAQKNPDDPTIERKYLLYRELDTIIRHQNLNQTNGLLPGPLYSRIIAEGILSRIDVDLKEQNLQFARYVDDYEVYLYDDNEKEVISTFEKVLTKYGFALNSEKTEVLEFPYYITSNLQKIFSEHTNLPLDTSNTMELFNAFFSIEKNGTRGAIRYLLKSLEYSSTEIDNFKLYKSYLLTILKNNERSLIKACALLIDIHNTSPLINREVNYIKELLNTHIRAGHDLEVIWLTYLLIKTENIKPDDLIIEKLVQTENELVLLLLLRNQLFLETQQLKICQKATSWILLYELYAADHIDEATFKEKLNISKNLNMYKKLKSYSVHFCDL